MIVGVAVVWHFELLPRWALAVLLAREAVMLVLVLGGLRLGLDLHINWLGRSSVWFTMGAVGAALLGWDAVKEPFLYIGLAGFAGGHRAVRPRRPAGAARARHGGPRSP